MRRIFVEVVGAYCSGVGAPLLSVSVIGFACLFFSLSLWWFLDPKNLKTVDTCERKSKCTI